ncbi:DUF222 domain-containing protein [Thermoleophilia bacterium SCSIO 60948]|nr:DUF222 domain-containing protein [Thermoleophilia bacterium SCSIO 60948]
MDPQSDSAPEEDREDPLRGLSLDAIETEIASLAAGLAASQARWLGLLGEFDRREGWASWGMRSCADWVAWRCALSTRSAREHVQIARALRELRLIQAEFEAGRLSYSKVRALCRIAEPATEADLLELAQQLTAAQLEGSVRAMVRIDEIQAREREERRRVSWFWEDDGCLELRATLPPEEGALLLAAIESARDELFALDDHSDPDDASEAQHENGTAVPRNEPADELPAPPPTSSDALLYICEKAMKRSREVSPSSCDRNQVVVHLDLAEDHAHVESGPSLHPKTARRLGCDAAAVAQIERGERVLSVGRRTRVVPPQIRRALAGRDPACRFPGCSSRRGLDAHHVRHWQDGGETALDNLVLVCRRHHRALHEGGCSVEQRTDGDGFVFRDPHDRLLERSPRPSRFKNGWTPDAAGPLSPGTGERADRALVVDALIAIRRRARARRGDADAQPDG